MTLERCSTLLDFALRRWLRLFPAMLVASVIILAFDLAFSIGPHGQRTWINLVPGLLFISPSLIHTVTGTMIEFMDGPFWSIYVEVSFYAIFGAVYFTCGTKEGDCYYLHVVSHYIYLKRRRCSRNWRLIICAKCSGLVLARPN